MSLIGDWSSRVHEDSTRNDPQIGEFAGLPLTPQALAHADAWDESRLTVIERQCVPNGAAWAFRGPAQIRIWEEKDPTTNDLVAIKTFNATFSQTRTIWMDGRPHPGKYAPHTWQGFSTGTWQGNMLEVKTTHLKRFFHRRNGVPQSDRATLTEYFIRHGTNYLTHVTMVEDPRLSEPLVQSQNFALVANVTPETYQTWTVCLASQEIAGRPPAMCRTISRQSVSQGALRQVPPSVRGDAPAPRRCTRSIRSLRQMLRALAPGEAPHTHRSRAVPTQPAPVPAAATPSSRSSRSPRTSTIGGAGGNITVNVGSNGLFVVDAGTEGASANVVAAIRTISDRPIRIWRTPVRMRTTSAGTLRSGRSVREFVPAKIERKGR